MNEQVSEIYGALIGDGCLSSFYSKSDKIQRNEISFTGSLGDRDYYELKIIPYFKSNFEVSGTLRQRKDCNAIIYSIRSNRVFDFFKYAGFPVGKKPNDLKMPDKIMKDSSLATACVRGIWNTDGSIYRRYTKQYKNHNKFYNNYFVMELKMKAKELLIQIKSFLESKNIKTSSITKNQNYVLRINSQEAIKRYLSTIGFSNPHHIRRIERFSSEILLEKI